MISGMDRESREKLHSEVLTDIHEHIWGYDTEIGDIRNDYRCSKLLAAAKIHGGELIFELGCGGGEYTKRFINKGLNLIASDISLSMLQKTRNEVGHFVKLSAVDAGNIPFKDNSFYAVIGNASLHHFDVDRALENIKRVLVKGGVLVFSEPNMLNPIIWMQRNIGWFRKVSMTSPDETAFTRWELAKKLLKHGFSDIAIEPFDFLYPKLNPYIFRLIKRFLFSLEKVPIIKEIAGSLLICARKR